MTVHQRRAARARYLAEVPAAGDIGTGVSATFGAAQAAAITDAGGVYTGALWHEPHRCDLHARRASQELQRMWLRAVHQSIRKARRFRGVRRRHAQAPKGREIAQGWYVE